MQPHRQSKHEIHFNEWGDKFITFSTQTHCLKSINRFDHTDETYMDFGPSSLSIISPQLIVSGIPIFLI